MHATFSNDVTFFMLKFATRCITYRADTSMKNLDKTQRGRDRRVEAGGGWVESYLSTLYASICWFFVL